MSTEFDLTTAVSYLRDNNCNVAMEFAMDKNGYLLFNLRATPWKSSSMAGQMILVADYNVEDALVRLAENVERREWTALNWRVRLDEPGTYIPGNAWALLKPRVIASENGSEAPEGSHRSKDTREAPKGR